jgi:hypothetical protein
MTLASFQRLIAHHKAKAEDLAKAASLMGDCPAAKGFFAQAENHARWAVELQELADSFRHCFGRE